MDKIVQDYISTTRTEWLTQFLYLYTVVFDFSTYFILLTISVAILIYLLRGLRYAVLFVGSLSFGAILVYILKNIFNVSRPDGGLVYAFGQSFPSYHATIGTIFYIMLMYIFDDYLSGLNKFLFNLVCFFAIFLMALSRVYLGVHWVSDVASGVVIGSIFSYGIIVISRNVRNAA